MRWARYVGAGIATVPAPSRRWLTGWALTIALAPPVQMAGQVPLTLSARADLAYCLVLEPAGIAP